MCGNISAAHAAATASAIQPTALPPGRSAGTEEADAQSDISPRERAFLAARDTTYPTRDSLWDSPLAGHPQHHGLQGSVPSRKQRPENIPEAWAVGHQERACPVGDRTCSRPWLAARGPKGKMGPEKQRLGLLWAQGSLAGEGRREQVGWGRGLRSKD